MTNPIFNISYKEAYSTEIQFQTQINEKQAGGEQRYPIWTYPKRVFTLKFDKSPTAREELESFFDNVKGSFSFFDWVWDEEKGGNGQTYECYFDSDTLEQNLNHLGFTETELKLVTIDRNPVIDAGALNSYYTVDYKFNKAWNTLLDKVFTAQNNRRSMWTAQKKSWTLSFQKTPENRKLIEDFFIAKKGKFKSFNWVWETSKGGDGNTYTVRIDTDQLNTDITALGYGSIQLPIKEVLPIATDETIEKDEIIPRRLLKIDLSTGPIRILDNETMEKLTYNEEDYLGAPLELGELEKNDNNEFSKVNIAISNVGQGISALVGSNGDVVTGANCTLSMVFLNVNTNEIIQDVGSVLFVGKANNLVLTNETASMDIESSLGGFEMTMPKMTYGVNCQWRKFKDCKCGYTGIESTCDRTLETCTRYGNVENFGGFPSLPVEQKIKV